MPLPLIGVLLARAAAAVATRTGIGVAAERLAGGKVLEGAGWNNARAMTAALSGRSAPSAASTGAAGKTPGIVQDAADRFRAWAQQRSAAASASKVGKDIQLQANRGTVAERYEQLRNSGRLPDAFSGAARSLGIATPSQEQVLGHADREEQARREKEAADKPDSMGRLAGRAAIGLMQFQLAIPLAITGIRKLGDGLLEAQRDLRRFDGRINNAFAQTDRQQMVLAGRTASATGDTTVLLANQLMKLREETQWSREAMVNAKNLVGTGMVGIARLLNQVIPTMKVGAWALQKVADRLPKSEEPKSNAYVDFLNDIRRGDFTSRPLNPAPGAGGGGAGGAGNGAGWGGLIGAAAGGAVGGVGGANRGAGIGAALGGLFDK